LDVKEEIDLGTAWDYIPTIMFGLGAVFLAKQPRGVLFDVMNRIRLRDLQREARRAEAEAAEVAAAAALPTDAARARSLRGRPEETA
jgi:hypothetical protein